MCRALRWRGSTTTALASTASPGRLIPRVTSAQQVTDEHKQQLRNSWIFKARVCWRSGCFLTRVHASCPPLPSRRPPGSDLGHPADAPGHRGPHPGLHGRRGDQQRAVGLHAARLDRHLLQQLPGDPPCIKTHSDTIFHPLLSSRG